MNTSLLYDSMMEIILVCKNCHREIHDNEAKAKEDGWIL